MRYQRRGFILRGFILRTFIGNVRRSTSLVRDISAKKWGLHVHSMKNKCRHDGGDRTSLSSGLEHEGLARRRQGITLTALQQRRCMG